MNLETQVGGHWTFTKYKAGPDGEPIKETAQVIADFDNLITDQGLEMMGTSSTYLSACQVGSGNATPAFTDTTLDTWVAGTGTTSSTGSSIGTGFVRYVKTFRFATGVAAGNLSEIGIGTAAASGPNLYSRALIVDSGGLPTTITILSDEILDATYEHRVYWPTVDGSGTITISGIDYDYVYRAVATNLVNGVFSSMGWGTYGSGTNASINSGASANSIYQSTAFNGVLVAINANQPTGNASTASSTISAAYVPSSLEREGSLRWAVTAGNLTGGISAVKVGLGWSSYQISFDPPIAKNSSQELTLTFKHSWSRATIP